MKKILFLIVILLLYCDLYSQNNSTQKILPKVVLVPNTEQLYVTEYTEESKMYRNAAVEACACKGDGWRLPTLGELQIMYSHKYEMDFAEGTYWTGEKVRGKFEFYALNFKNGNIRKADYDNLFFVRCVYDPRLVKQQNEADNNNNQDK